MTFRGRSAVRAARLVALTLAATSAVECTSDSPSGPRVLDVRAAGPRDAKAPQGPAVSSANPPYGDQGTTLDVQILGSGFTSGAAATWLLNGVADNHVHTNNTRFVSSTEVDANITIASDATIAFWDVQVALIGGKNGVGSDAFEVTSAQVLAPVNVSAVYGADNLGEIVGFFGSDAFVIDDALRFVDLGNGQAWGLEPQGTAVLGRGGVFPNEFATVWTRQDDGSWTATTLPPAPNSVNSNATSAAYAADGSLLVGGFDAAPGPHAKTTEAANRPVVWQRVGTTWMPPIIYALPAGATQAGARAVNGLGQIAGNVDASGVGAVWDSPSTPTRLDGLPHAINSAGTLIVGERASGTTTAPVYWWRDPVSRAWHTTGVPLPSIANTACSSGGHAFGLNDNGVVVGDSCNANAKTQATVWTLDLSGGTPVLVGSAQSLPGIGAKGSTSPVSSAVGVSSAPPYVVSGSAAQSPTVRFAVRWLLR